MKINCLFLTALILALASIGFAQSNSNGQEVKRLQNETAENFAKRNGRAAAELVHKVIETEAWGNQKTIFAFYNGAVSGQVDGYVFVPKSPDTYQKILIYNFEEEGGTPNVEAVFFVKADKDKAQELAVICSWEAHHYDVSGKLYHTYIFDDINSGASPARLKLLEAVSEKVSGGCDCVYRDGKTKGTKKFETAAQVKAGLMKLGFR
ncbi:MAG: hypothetical protein QOF02_3479 [Blastocatellia bacterium]|jgi:hypothetical protein|nr:hypothetical protein [Blastocatellia bacterium]